MAGKMNLFLRDNSMPTDVILATLANPETSYWLRGAIKSSLCLVQLMHCMMLMSSPFFYATVLSHCRQNPNPLTNNVGNRFMR